MTDDFDAKLVESRLPLDDDERSILREAVSHLDRLVGHLADPLAPPTSDPLDGWTRPKPSTGKPIKNTEPWPMPTVATMADAIRTGKANSRSLTELCLNRIEQYDARLSTFLTLTADQARRSADTADAELRRGHDRGILHGIPYALKDAFDTAGIRTTVGSRVFANRVPVHNAALVDALENAGAVLLGKLDTAEFCFGGPSRDGGFGPAIILGICPAMRADHRQAPVLRLPQD